MKLDLAEIERRANAATRGPWFFNSYSALYSAVSFVQDEEGEKDYEYIASVDIQAGDTATKQGYANAAHIASASPDVVLEMVRRLRGMQEALTFYATAAASKELLYAAPDFRGPAIRALKEFT